MKEQREQDSGYFSLGRSAVRRAFPDQSPSAPYRHLERGHPLPSNKSPEPKATIPFRNPDLGVPSERRTSEFQNAAQLAKNNPPQYPPEELDLSLEDKALAGPRALSYTPINQDESFWASSRKDGRNAHTSPLWQSGTLNSSQRGSGLSRSSSPSRSTSVFRRGESDQDQASVSLAHNRYSGNLRSFASTVGSISSINKSQSYMDLRGTLQEPETNSSFIGSTENHGSSSPSRRSYDSPAVRKTEAKSPSYEHGHDREGLSSSSLKSRYDSRSQSHVGRLETNVSSNQTQESRRSASPVRKGYGAPNQSDRQSISNGWSYDRKSPSPSRRSYEMQSQATVKKPEARSSLHSYSRDSRHSSPNRGPHQNPGPSSLHKSKTSPSSYNRGPESCSPSPLAQSQSPPRKSESGWSSTVSALMREIADHASLRNTMSDRTGSTSYLRKTLSGQSQQESNPSSGRWRGSSHSLHSQSVSNNCFPSHHSREEKQISSFTRSASDSRETPQDRNKGSSVRQNPEVKSSMSNHLRAQRPHRSSSPPVQRHTSSHSSVDSESGHLSAGSLGHDPREDSMMTDLPKVKAVFQREDPSHLRKTESRQKQELPRYKPASHSQSKAPHWE
ncbi:serine/arginine repetitive matrix protein 2-like [Carassius auratus]|uniref:Serine/arginine repetitive matrix protein 2-like n=1 Tax=Carassius auratus TaxID=7957 RepID=A0A6P6KW75_CARAU|nr:serine/arginine repetitive matrix protein 2-like [Carassius auratus]